MWMRVGKGLVGPRRTQQSFRTGAWVREAEAVLTEGQDFCASVIGTEAPEQDRRGPEVTKGEHEAELAGACGSSPSPLSGTLGLSGPISCWEQGRAGRASQL